jgi:hypothetical protein
MADKTLASWQGTAEIDPHLDFGGAYSDESFAVILAQLHSIGDQAPYFSVTGETWTSEAAWRVNRTNALHSAGAQHDLALKLFPHLGPVVALHLSDDHGVPLHAFANSWYWYSDYDGKGVHDLPGHSEYAKLTAHERAAAYLRVRPELLPIGMGLVDFKAYVESLRPQWQLEADRALDLIVNPPSVDLDASPSV